MKPDLQYDFLLDKVARSITIRREFAAKRQSVWDCHTKSELLDQWFAPKPFTLKTKSMDFREGGRWQYAMVDPEGSEHWAYFEYQKIRPIEHFQSIDVFCDESGELNPELPSQGWDVTFADRSAHTLVKTILSYKSTEDFEKVIDMGLQDGMNAILAQLDDLLSTLGKRSK